MKKKLSACIMAAALFAMAAVPASAQGTNPRLIDNADLLTDSEEENVMAALDEVSEEHQIDVAVVSVEGTDGENTQTFADNVYEQLDYGYGDDHDGIMLLIDMGDREWYITTEGKGIIAADDDNIDYISERMSDSLSDGDYEQALIDYANACDDVITDMENGTETSREGSGYSEDNSFNVVQNLLIAIILGLIVGFIYTRTLKGQLKSVYSHNEANDYVKQGSMKVTDSREMFLYSNVTRVEKPQNQNKGGGGGGTHMSAGGRSHGGHGGGF